MLRLAFAVILAAMLRHSLADEADQESPEYFLKEFDKDGDGLVSMEEIHDGVAKMSEGEDGMPDEDQKEFDEKFKPLLTEKFPKADADGSGKLDAAELAALIKMFEEHQEGHSEEM